jgi:hypothetical protein
MTEVTTMEKDPIYGMQVEPNKAAGKASIKVRPFTSAAPVASASLTKNPSST